MKKVLLLFLAVAGLTFTACEKDEIDALNTQMIEGDAYLQGQIDDLVVGLANLTTQLETAVTNLTNAITAEVAARIEGDKRVQDAVDALTHRVKDNEGSIVTLEEDLVLVNEEIDNLYTTIQNNVNTLTGLINSNTTLISNVNDELADALLAEEQARIDGDNTLAITINTQIGTLSSTLNTAIDANGTAIDGLVDITNTLSSTIALVESQITSIFTVNTNQANQLALLWSQNSTQNNSLSALWDKVIDLGTEQGIQGDKIATLISDLATLKQTVTGNTNLITSEISAVTSITTNLQDQIDNLDIPAEYDIKADMLALWNQLDTRVNGNLAHGYTEVSCALGAIMNSIRQEYDMSLAPQTVSGCDQGLTATEVQAMIDASLTSIQSQITDLTTLVNSNSSSITTINNSITSITNSVTLLLSTGLTQDDANALYTQIYATYVAAKEDSNDDNSDLAAATLACSFGNLINDIYNSGFASLSGPIGGELQTICDRIAATGGNNGGNTSVDAVPYADGSTYTKNGRTNNAAAIETLRTYVDDNGDYWMLVIGDGTVRGSFTVNLKLNDSTTTFKSFTVATNSDTSILWKLGQLTDTTTFKLRSAGNDLKTGNLGAYKVTGVTWMNPSLN